MTATIIQFIPRPNPNRDSLMGVIGVSAQCGDVNDPLNPNMMALEQQAIEIGNVALVDDSSPAEYTAPETDPA